MKTSLFLWSCLLMGLQLPAQNLAQWSFENLTTAIPILPLSPSVRSQKVDWGQATIQGGNNTGSPNICSGAESWSTNFWPTSNSRNPSEYMQFTAKLKDRYDAHVTGFFFRSNISSNSAARRFDVYYSIDNFSSDVNFLGSATNSTLSYCDTYSYNLSQPIYNGGRITFRIYPYGQDISAQAATMRIDNVTILGTAVLPVELINWEIIENNGQVHLKWSTASELNHAYFEVERKINDQPFAVIHKVEGQGNSFANKSYHFIDEKPGAGHNLYRLKQVDQDSTIEYSDYLNMWIDRAGFIVYPTAAIDQLVISGSTNTTFTYQIIDLQGQLKIMAKGQREKTIVDVSQLPNGIYWMRIIHNSNLTVRQFVKR